MDPNTTILRVKRKRGTDPADALLLACKRIRPETSQTSGETVPEPSEGEVENSVFKLVATVATQDAPVQTQVRQALARPRTAQALRPSAASSQWIMGDLRSTKWSTRREERYRLLSSHRAGLPSPAEQQNSEADLSEGVEKTGKEQGKCWSVGEIQVVDLVHENLEDQDNSSGKSSDPEVILCNNTNMLRDHLSLSGERLGEEHREQDDDYVYDLYYQETDGSRTSCLSRPTLMRENWFLTLWSMKRRCMKTTMMKTRKATGGMTILMRKSRQTVTERNVMVSTGRRSTHTAGGAGREVLHDLGHNGEDEDADKCDSD